MSDEKYYAHVVDEMSGNYIDNAIMAKAIVLAEGDENKARIEYVKLRVKRLKSENLKLNAIKTAATGVGLVKVTPFRKIVILLLKSYAILFSILLVYLFIGYDWNEANDNKYLAVASIIISWVASELLKKPLAKKGTPK